MLDWRPDWAYSDNRYLITATGVIPATGGGYKSSYAAAATDYTTALSGACTGAAILKTAAGVSRLYAGSSTKIEEANGTTGWTDRSRGGGYSNGNRYVFAADGDNHFACNGIDGQDIQLSTSGAFADLANAPTAHCIVVCSRVLLAFGYDISGTNVPDGWITSDTNGFTTWTAAAGNECADGQLTETTGPITAAAVMNDVVLVWKERGMWQGRYVGGDKKWDWVFMSPHFGCSAPDAWVSTSRGIFFANSQGVYLFDGSVPRPIDEGLRNFFNVQATIFAITVTQISHDERDGAIYVWTRQSNGTTSRAFCFNYLEGRWSQAYQSGYGAAAPTGSFLAAVRNANAVDAAGSGIADSTVSLTGGGRAHYFFASSDDKLYNLNGQWSDGTITLAHFGIRPESEPRDSWTLERVFPKFRYASAPSSLSLALSAYSTFYPDGSSGAASTHTMNASKVIDVQKSGTTFDATYTASNDDLEIVGFEYQWKKAGYR